MKDKTINDYQNQAHELALRELWKQELKKKVEGKKKEKTFVGASNLERTEYIHYSGTIDGYNQALEDIIKLLEE